MPMVGRSSVMQEVYRAIARMTNSDLPALISGPSGTGKSLTAKVIHDAGRRKELPFLSCNMTASSPANIAMTLFGDGTGHNSGIMNNAQGGTIFLNEIGNMPPDIQSQLLDRLIAQENWEENQKFRLICATSCDLLQRVEEGKFRNDLYYRLNIIPLRIPALEERREDIPDLTRHFFKASADEGTGAKHIEADALKVLRSHNWPGNVRELENLIKRICVLHSQETVTVDIIKAELNLTSHAGVTRSDPSPNLDQLRNITHQLISEHFEAYAPDLPPTGIYQEFLTEFEYPVLTIALAATNGNQIKAAELLGINRNTLRKKIRAHGIKILKTAH
jgi:two-component system nitrogen regulation response regulator GlnG